MKTSWNLMLPSRRCLQMKTKVKLVGQLWSKENVMTLQGVCLPSCSDQWKVKARSKIEPNAAISSLGFCWKSREVRGAAVWRTFIFRNRELPNFPRDRSFICCLISKYPLAIPRNCSKCSETAVPLADHGFNDRCLLTSRGGTAFLINDNLAFGKWPSE